MNVKNPNRRKINGMIWYMDSQIGLIVNALRVKGMYENTLIIMTTDNGGFIKFRAAGNNYPLRGGKTSFFDGAIRVNAFISGGFLPLAMRGKVINEYIHAADMYPTILDFAGLNETEWKDEKAEKFKLPPIDGISMKDLFLGNRETSGREEIFVSPNCKKIEMCCYTCMHNNNKIRFNQREV